MSSLPPSPSFQAQLQAQLQVQLQAQLQAPSPAPKPASSPAPRPKNFEETWEYAFKEAQTVLEAFTQKEGKLFKQCCLFSKKLVNIYRQGGTVFSCGNGGSYCDALHYAEELTGRFRQDRPPLPALALGEASHSTCVANDYGFKYIFARQIMALGRKGDGLILLSTSGKSPNLIEACQRAKEKEIQCFALLGGDGGPLKDLADISIVVPHSQSDRVQEMHIKILHTSIENIERELFPPS